MWFVYDYWNLLCVFVEVLFFYEFMLFYCDFMIGGKQYVGIFEYFYCFELSDYMINLLIDVFQIGVFFF